MENLAEVSAILMCGVLTLALRQKAVVGVEKVRGKEGGGCT